MLTLIFALAAPVISALICFLTGYSGGMWLLMFAVWGIAAFLALVIVYLLIVFIPAIFVDRSKPQETISPFFHFFVPGITELLCRFGGLRIQVEGLENVPTDRNFLLVGNHRSNYDPIIALYVLRKFKLSFVSKPENFKIPFINNIIHKCCFLPIDRNDDRKAIATILTASKQLTDGVCSVGIYPEGSRNRNSVDLLPFKGGSFKIAQRNSAPIVVMAIDGSEMIHRRFPRPTPIRVTICGVIEQEPGKRISTQILAAQAQQMLCDTLGVRAAAAEE